MQCEVVSQKEYKRISDVGDSVMWLCQRCRVNFQNMAEENRELQEENKKLKDENKELRRRMDTLEEKMRSLKGEIIEETIEEVMKRMKVDERKKQEENIGVAVGSISGNDIKKRVNEYINTVWRSQQLGYE